MLSLFISAPVFFVLACTGSAAILSFLLGPSPFKSVFIKDNPSLPTSMQIVILVTFALRIGMLIMPLLSMRGPEGGDVYVYFSGLVAGVVATLWISKNYLKNRLKEVKFE